MSETDDKLRQTLARLALAQQFAGAGVWDWDIETGQFDWSPELFQLFGLDPEKTEPGFDSWRGVVHPEDRHAAEDRIKRALRDHVPLRSEYRVVLPTGDWRWIQALGNTRYDERGEPSKMAGICLDVTDRRNAERRLRTLQAEQELILDTVPAMIWYKDTTNRILRVNATAARSLGLNKESIEGRSTAEFYPDQADRYFRDDQIVIRTGRARLGIEEPYPLPSGEIRWISTDKVPLKDESGRVSRLLVMSIDITERKRLEAEAKRHLEQLREADRRKDEFLAMLGHELRNPLTPLRNAAEILQTRDLDTATIGWCSAMIERQVTFLTRLVDDLLDVARVNQGRITLRKQELELNEVVKRAVEASKPVLAGRQHRLSVELPDRSPRVSGDLIRLTQVVTNLLSNAANYTQEGGRIGVIVKAEADVARIHVRDNGCGIDPTDLAKVFDMFYQAQPTIDRQQGGLGIGLFLVRSLVTMHGGTVQAVSAGAGRGSEFLVSLPARPSGSVTDAGTAFDPPPLARRRRILVVDDNHDAAQSLRFLLQGLGHEVLIAHDGPKAMDIARAERPEILILDIGLPGLDGYQVASAVRQDPGLKGSRIVAVTGYGEASVRTKALAAGFDAYLPKPVSLRDLLMALDLTG